MKTKEKFTRLANYITEHYSVQDRDTISISENFKFYKDGDDFFKFYYFELEVTVMWRSMDVRLPDHIDFSQFDPKILLRDLWKEAQENRIEKCYYISDTPFLRAFPGIWVSAGDGEKIVTIDEIAEKFNVAPDKLKIKK